MPISRFVLLQICAGLIGLIVLFASVPVDFITGASAYWQHGGEDAMAGQVGLTYFLAEPWGWPLLHISTLGNGTTAAQTDSIPLFALAIKSIGLKNIHPYGVWVAICYVLLPITATRCAWLLGIKNLGNLGLALLVVCLPTFQLRLIHASLEGQFIILCAFEAYLRRRNDNPSAASEMIIPTIAMLIHPYLAGMCLAFVVATWGLSKERGPMAALLTSSRWLAGFALAGLVSRLLGYQAPMLHIPPEWGHFSLNIASLTHPSSSLILGGDGSAIDATGGQSDEKGWVGLGAAILILFGLPLLARKDRDLGLTLACIGCLAFAITTRIYVGNTNILDFYPKPLMGFLEIFRASSRFVWVPILVVAIASAARINSNWPKYAQAILISIGLLQLVDTIPARQETMKIATIYEPNAFDWDVVDRMIAQSRKVELRPSHQCTFDPLAKIDVQLQVLASRHAIPINSVREARETVDCYSQADDTEKADKRPGTLRIFLDMPNATPRWNGLPAWTQSCPKLPMNPSGEMRLCQQ